MRTVLLLLASNVFMTFAWYGHLKPPFKTSIGVKTGKAAPSDQKAVTDLSNNKKEKGLSLWKAILISWGIAFFEYCLMVPANRLGYANGFTGFQLKITQEIITLVVFGFFAVWYLKEPLEWKYLISFCFLLGAIYFMFKK
jgi:uncharacterized protein